MSRLLRSLTSRCLALLVSGPALPLAASAQALAAPRDSAILAGPFAEDLNVNVAKLTRVASGVFTEDLTRGSGPEATRGVVALIRIQMWLTDATLVRSGTCSSMQFQVGTGLLIDGVDIAIRGMRPGGTRLIVIGAEQAYGDRGVGQEIPPGATLVDQHWDGSGFGYPPGGD